MKPEISTAVMIERIRGLATDSADSQDRVLFTQAANRIELLLAAESGMSREMACIRHALDIPPDQSVQSGVVDAFVLLNAKIQDLSGQLSKPGNARWCPSVDPISGSKLFLWLEHPTLGCVPTYGGPYDSFTLTERDENGDFFRHRYDHDEGAWVDDEAVYLEELEELEVQLAELRGQELNQKLVTDALHVAIALNSAGVNPISFDESVRRLHEWGSIPDYAIALYVDFIYGNISENKLLDFGYISDNGSFSARQAEQFVDKMRSRIDELETQLRGLDNQIPASVPDYMTRLTEPTISNILSDDDNSPMAHAAMLAAVSQAERKDGDA